MTFLCTICSYEYKNEVTACFQEKCIKKRLDEGIGSSELMEVNYVKVKVLV